MKLPNPILREIDHRDELPVFLNKHNLCSAGVEVGVFTGSFSETILKTWHGNHLLLVDPYKAYSKAEYFDSTQDREQEGVFAEAKWKLRNYPAAEFRRKESLAAAHDILDDALDFVFVDGNHAYESVTNDIAAWWPKVKSGGVFAGHDFYGRFKDTNSDAATAVLDFAEAMDQRPYVTNCSSWWFIKP